MSTEAMPPLPEPTLKSVRGDGFLTTYTAEQMRQYARTYAADLERRLQEAGRVPHGLVDRVKAAAQRIQDNHAPRRIPADPTDVDLVLAEVLAFIEGREPPFWVPTPSAAAGKE